MNAQNARIKREIEQVAAECRREIQRSNSQAQRRPAALSFNQIDYDRRAPGRDASTEVVQLPGTYQQLDVTRYAAGGLWVYATTLHDGWGDHQYFVYNPDTCTLLHFAPEAARRLMAGARRRRLPCRISFCGSNSQHKHPEIINNFLNGFFLTAQTDWHWPSYLESGQLLRPFGQYTLAAGSRYGLLARNARHAG